MKAAGAPAAKLEEINEALELFTTPVISAGPEGLEMLLRYRDLEDCE